MEFIKDFSSPGWPNYSDEVTYDIVTVHGLFQSSKCPWEDNGVRLKWLREDLFQGNEARLMAFSYESAISEGRIHTRAGLQNEALRLLDSLIEHRGDGIEKTRPLAFLSSDVGGILLKNVFVLAAQNQEKYGDILRATYAIIFLDCPHRPTRQGKLVDQIAGWICKKEYVTIDGLVQTSMSFLSSILEVNGLFLESGMILRSRIVNVFSEHEELTERVFSQFSATLDAPTELRLSSPRSLATLLCAADDEDDEDSNPASVQEVLAGRTEDTGTSFSPGVLKSLQHQLSFTPPLYLNQDELNDGDLEWILANQNFTKWMGRSGPRFLHLIRGTSQTNPLGTFLRFLKKPEKNNDSHIFFFKFSKDDSRFNNTKALLTTFIAEALAISPTPIPDLPAVQHLEEANTKELVQEQDLMKLLLSLLDSFRKRNERVVMVIWNLDGCLDSLFWLFESIVSADTFSELQCQIFLESSGSEKVLEATSLFKMYVVQSEQSLPPTKYQGLCDMEVKNLTQEHPELVAHSELLDKAVARHQEHSILDLVITRWICNHTRRITTRSLMAKPTESLEYIASISTQRLILDIMGSIPQDGRQWAKRVLSLVNHSFRPLSLWELEDAMSFEEKTDSDRNSNWRDIDISSKLQECFLGLLIVQNNEVSFICPTVRAYLSSQESHSQEWYTKDADAHLEIFRTLIRYLSRDQGSLVSPPRLHWRGQLSHPVPSRFDFSSYAAEFWLHHYQEVRKKFKLSIYEADLRKFLNNAGAMTRWAFMMDLEQPQEGFKSQDFVAHESLLSLAARIGLDTSDFEVLYPGWSSNDELLCVALLEAIRNGHTAVVKTMQLPSAYKMPSDVLTAGAACRDPEMIKHLFEKNKETTKFPKIFLEAAAFLGVHNVITDVLEGRISDDEDSLRTDLLSSLLAVSIRSRQTFITQLLTKEIPAPQLTLSLMKTACQFGDLHAVQLFLDKGFDIKRFDPIEITDEPLRIACLYGNFGTVELLAAKRVFSERDDLAVLWECLEVTVTQGFTKCASVLLDLVGREATLAATRKSQLWEHFMIGVLSGQVNVCRVFLEKGVNCNEQETWNDEPVLSYAFGNGGTDMIQLLLDYHTPLEARESLGNTSLIIAATQELPEIVAFLLKKGADVNARASFGGTALYQACLKNNLEIVQLLLEHGADVNLSTHLKDWSPLEGAYDFPRILRLIVDKSPDFKRVAGGTTALWRAARGGYVESVEILLTGDPDIEFAPKDYKEEQDGRTPLAIAAEGGHAKVVELLLEAGSNINYSTPKGDFVLKFAANDDTVAALLRYNPNLDLVDENGDSALHVFATRPSEALAPIKRLVNAGAKVKALNKAGETPLNLSAATGNHDVIKYLISKGADINSSAGYLGGPLHQACRRLSLDNVRALVQSGADVNLSHYAMGVPLAWACTSPTEQFDKIKYLVEEACADVTIGSAWKGHPLSHACLRCDLDTVKYLAVRGGVASLSQADNQGRPPLFYACFRVDDALEVVQYLISQGVDISAKVKDKMGRTVLHCAVVSNSVALVKHLIKLDKNLIHEADADGWTPLHWAMRKSYLPRPKSYSWYSRPVVQEHVTEIVSLLLEAGRQDLEKMGRAAGRDWSLVDIARYHNVYKYHKDKLNTGTAQKQATTETVELKPKRKVSKAAKFHHRVCDGCFCEIWGMYSQCTDAKCEKHFDLCYKCAGHKEVMHDLDHKFIELGPEFDEYSDSDSYDSRSSSANDGNVEGDGDGNVELDDAVVSVRGDREMSMGFEDSGGNYWNDLDIDIEDL